VKNGRLIMERREKKEKDNKKILLAMNKLYAERKFADDLSFHCYDRWR